MDGTNMKSSVISGAVCFTVFAVMPCDIAITSMINCLLSAERGHGVRLLKHTTSPEALGTHLPRTELCPGGPVKAAPTPTARPTVPPPHGNGTRGCSRRAQYSQPASESASRAVQQLVLAGHWTSTNKGRAKLRSERLYISFIVSQVIALI